MGPPPRALLVVAMAFSVAAGVFSAVSRTVEFADGGLRSALVAPDAPSGVTGFEWSRERVEPAAQQRQVLDRQGALAAVLAGIVVLVAFLGALAHELFRNLSRRREVAIHRAVGASWRRLRRAVTREGTVVTLFGLGTGLALGHASASAVLASWPGSVAPGIGTLPLLAGSVVLAVAFLGFLLASWQAGVVAGAGLPGATFQAPPPDPYSGIAVLQIAASVALLLAASVLVDGGPPPAPGVTGSGSVERDGWVATVQSPTPVDSARLLRELQRVPGLTSAWVASPGWSVGLGTTDFALTECGRCMIGTSPVHVKGEDAVHFAIASVGPRAPLTVLAGRGLGPEDASAAEPVALVSEAFSQMHFERGEAIGRRIRIGADYDNWHRVVGVVDENPAGVGFGAGAQVVHSVYVSAAQLPARTVEVRAFGTVDEALLLQSLRSVADGARVDVVLAADHALRAAAPARWLGRAFGLLGLAALFCALLGVHAVTKLSLVVRTTELGVHRAVGASRRALLQLALGQPLRASLIGVALGLYLSTFFLDALSEAVGSALPSWPYIVGVAGAHVVATLTGALPATVAFVRSEPSSMLAAAES